MNVEHLLYVWQFLKARAADIISAMGAKVAEFKKCSEIVDGS